jgi:gamma-glutamylcyclotransferase (GGCT)/AIG2-like uncharacterized protein YtfP
MDKQFYFAYGSNMDEEQMTGRCPGCVKIGIARLNGYRFFINSRGVASVVPDSGHIVRGILWELSGDHVTSLDSYEGVRGNYYHKIYLQVVLVDRKEPVIALVYAATDNEAGKPRKNYLENILSAAKRHGLDAEYIQELRGWGLQ